MRNLRFEYKIALIYLIIGSIWILCSDTLVDQLFYDSQFLITFHPIEGISYVIATTVLLLFLIKRHNRKQHDIKEKLRETSEKYKSMYEQAPLAYQSLDNDGNFIDVNPQWLAILGYRKEEVIGKWFGDFLHPDYVSKFKVNFPRFKKQGHISNIKFKMKRKNGEYIYVAYEGCIGYTKDGEFKQTYCTFKDITAEYLYNQKITESEERFKSLFYNNISIMLLIDSEDGQIIDANQAALSFYGYSADEFKKLKITDINTAPKEEIDERVQRVLNKQNNHFQFKHKLANGVIRDVEVYSSEISEKGKKMLFSIVHDITKQLCTEQELIEAKEKAEESDRLKSAFLANMSHEIRTPLNGILGFANLLSNEPLSPETTKSYAGIINTSGNRLLELINNLLDISKIESGSMPLNIQEFTPSLNIDELLKVFAVNAKNKNIQLLRNIQPEHEHVTFFSDPFKIDQILINLISNAIKFTNRGFVKVSYEMNGDSIIYSVIDTGPGIPKTEQSKLFQRFYQINQNFLTREHEGSGLGLALCKSLTEMLNGKIWIESNLGKGSGFFFKLPKIQP